MTLIITAVACLITLFAWRSGLPENRYRLDVLALIYLAAALMWTVDGFACLFEGEPFVELHDAATMVDDALLGAVVVLAGLIAWAAYRLVQKHKLAAC